MPPQYGGYDPNGPQTPQDAKARARAEKAYRKAQRPFYKKKRFIFPALFLLLIVIIVASSGGGSKTTSAAGDTTTNDTSGGAPCAGDYADKQAEDVCADANDTVTLQGLTVTATPLKTSDNGIGGRSLCTDVTLKNGSGESKDYNALDFKIQTPNGDVATASAMGVGATLGSGTLVAGGTKSGKLCRDDATEKGQYVVIYKPNPWMDDRGVWLFTV